MAKKTTRKASTTKSVRTQTTSPTVTPPRSRPAMEDHHKAFSHIMYGLFLLSIAFAAYYTFAALGQLSQFTNSEYFYPIIAIMMLLWSFLFWEFGHRVHTA